MAGVSFTATGTGDVPITTAAMRHIIVPAAAIVKFLIFLCLNITSSRKKYKEPLIDCLMPSQRVRARRLLITAMFS
jgi:hypothetical protein